MEAERGVHPAAMGGTPLTADEAQGNLDFFPDLFFPAHNRLISLICNELIQTHQTPVGKSRGHDNAQKKYNRLT